MIEINNLNKEEINEGSLRQIVSKLLKAEKKELDISVAFIGQNEIRRLNRKYRKKDKVTDVLSVFYKKENVGEIVICLREAKMGICSTLIHGLLHVIGYDHEESKIKEKQMKEKEDYYVKKLCLSQKQ